MPSFGFLKKMKQFKGLKNKKNIKFNISQKGRTLPFWIVVGMFLITTVFFTIETATSGAELARLEHSEQVLLEENRTLSSQLLQRSSLSNLSESAESLGYKKPTKVIYILEPAGVAKVPQP